MNSTISNNYSISTKNIAFTARNPNLRLGEKVLKEIRNTYGYLHSDSYVDLKITQIYKKPKYEELIGRLLKLSDKYEKDRSALRKSYDSFINPNKKMVSGIVAYKVANCGELSRLVFNNLIAKGIKARRIAFDFYDIESGSRIVDKDHCFTVLGLKKGAKLNNPKTWGSKAIIIDPFFKISGNAHDCIEYMKMQMKFNEKKHSVQFSNKTTISQRLTSWKLK